MSSYSARSRPGRPEHGFAYLDNASTTPLRPEALAAMLPILTENFGNPSGSHGASRTARAALEDAREDLAASLGAEAGEVVFTSGGTESDNLAVTGLLARRPGKVLCSAVEHRAVLAPCLSAGAALVPVDGDGLLDLEALAGALGPEVSLVSVMLVNNEVGTVQPLAEVAALVAERAPGAVLHTDAVQAMPWLDVASLTEDCGLVTVSAHKLGGPKGSGALVVRDGVRLEAQARGGGQERGRRSGTHDVAGAVGLAVAARRSVTEREATITRVSALRDRLADGLLEAVPDSAETCRRELKVAGNCHLRFPGVEAEELLILLDDAGVCASAGSACSSGAIEPSHVLVAMGLGEEAASALRFSLGPTTTAAEVDLALEVVPKAVARLRG